MCGKTCFGRSCWPWSLQPRLGWDRVFQSQWGHGYLSLDFIVRFVQVAVTAGFTLLLVIPVHRISWTLNEDSWSQWPRGLRRRSTAYRLLRLWVRIQRGHGWVSVCCECCVLSGRGLCDGLITRPEESYRLWCVVVCDLETFWMRRLWPAGGCRVKSKQKVRIGLQWESYIRIWLCNLTPMQIKVEV